ncbi:MAG: DUF6036 family nucleotidyltransferase [Clostridiales bacterium]|nr:DUF6036 family nucleotidyltransferase [Clostridiales bacterium]
MLKLTRDELMKRLLRLDEDADLSLDPDERCHLVIVGGGALIIQRYIIRATHDLDAISVSPKLLSLLEKYDINCRVQTFINNFPYNYEDRLVPLFQGRKIDFFTASLEDMVIAKLYSRRPVDQSDVEAEEVLKNLNWDLLDKLATDDDEAKASVLNERNYADFMVNYENYIRRFCPCGN